MNGNLLVLEPSAYFQSPGLSNSGMSDLSVSPLRYWFRHINPARVEEPPTAAMQFGSALHCAVLEPDKFDARYACKVIPEDYDGCLINSDDLKGWLKDKGFAPKGTRKAGWIEQVQAVDPEWPIYDVIAERHAAQHAGKVMFSTDDWLRIDRAKMALLNEPRLLGILSDGEPEASILDVRDPELDVPLKARLDWVAPTVTLDIKTFSQTRGKSIDKTVTDAIWYEGYGRQAYFYTYLRMLLGGNKTAHVPTFVFAFVESEEPHEVRLRALRPTTAGQPNLYWDRARLEVRALIRRYADYWERYGENPWRDQQEIDLLIDDEIPQLAWSL